MGFLGMWTFPLIWPLYFTIASSMQISYPGLYVVQEEAFTEDI